VGPPEEGKRISMSSVGIKGRRSVDGKKECTKGVHSFLFGVESKDV